MTEQIINMRESRVATVRHIGAYERISEAFMKLGELAGAAQLHGAETVSG